MDPSCKSIIGCTVGIERGADIVRVHNVREMVRVVRMTDALVRG